MWVDKLLPQMRCDDNCGECCGIIGCSEEEFAKVLRYTLEHKIKPIAQGLKCPFFQNGRCVIYIARPMVCRMFGHLERLTCPRGYNVNIGEKTQKKIEARYMPLNHGLRILHEFAYSWPEIKKMMVDEMLRIEDEELKEESELKI